MLVELDALGLPDVGVELVGAVITRPQRDAVIGYIVQETRLCGGKSSKFVCLLKQNQKIFVPWSQEIIISDLDKDLVKV